RAGDHDRDRRLAVQNAGQRDHAIADLLAEGLRDGAQVLAADAVEHAADELDPADLLRLRRAAAGRAAAHRKLALGLGELALEPPRLRLQRLDACGHLADGDLELLAETARDARLLEQPATGGLAGQR